MVFYNLLRLFFFFRIYDIDNDGFISNGELFQVMKMISGTNLKEDQLQQVVDKSIIMFDKVLLRQIRLCCFDYHFQDGKGKLNFSEFCQVVSSTEVNTKMEKYKSGISV